MVPRKARKTKMRHICARLGSSFFTGTVALCRVVKAGVSGSVLLLLCILLARISVIPSIPDFLFYLLHHISQESESLRLVGPFPLKRLEFLEVPGGFEPPLSSPTLTVNYQLLYLITLN